jgi:hypothetical protein
LGIFSGSGTASISSVSSSSSSELSLEAARLFFDELRRALFVDSLFLVLGAGGLARAVFFTLLFR